MGLLRRLGIGSSSTAKGVIDAGSIRRMIEKGKLEQARGVFEEEATRLSRAIDACWTRIYDLRAEQEHQLSRYSEAKQENHLERMRSLKDKVEMLQVQIRGFEDEKQLLLTRWMELREVESSTRLIAVTSGDEQLKLTIRHLNDRLELDAEHRIDVADDMKLLKESRATLLKSSGGSREESAADDNFERKYGITSKKNCQEEE